jgi:hypothetical protein
MTIFTLATLSWLVAVVNGNQTFADPDCPRYLEAMKRPDVIATLVAWRGRLPETFDKKKYPRILEASGFGAYSIALDFDHRKLGLDSTAHAEISVDPRSKRIRFAAITDAKSTGFVFLFKGYEYMFEHSAMKSPRISNIGVACATSRDSD